MRTLHIFMLVFLGWNASLAQPGILDKSYGDQGVVISNLGQSEIVYDGLKTASDQIVLCGVYTDYNNIQSSFIARYHEDGTLDNIFGLGGKTLISFPNRKISVTSMARQSNGDYLLCGPTSINNQASIFVVRCDSNGNLDQSFGNSGFAFYTNDTTLLVTPKLAVLENDHILVGATTYRSFHGLDMAFVWFTKNGQLETSKGDQGLSFQDLNGGSDELSNFSVMPDGSIFAVGFTYQPDQNLYALAYKFKPDGTLDQSYGNNGLTVIQGGSTYASMVEEDGTLYMAGNTHIDGYNVLSCIRCTPEGQVDNNFGVNGTATIKLPEEYPKPYAMYLDEDGKVTIGGYASGRHDDDALLCRLDSNGKPDSSFSYDGYLMANLTLQNEDMRVILQHSDGNLLLIGSGGTYPNKSDIVMASYQSQYGLSIYSHSNEALIYPNPNRGDFRVELDIPIASIRCFDLQGQLVQHMEVLNLLSSDVHLEAGPGLYLVEVITSSGSIIRKKVLVN